MPKIFVARTDINSIESMSLMFAYLWPTFHQSSGGLCELGSTSSQGYPTIDGAYGIGMMIWAERVSLNE